MVGNDTEVNGRGPIDVILSMATGEGKSAINLNKHAPCSGRDLNRQTPEYKPETLLNEPDCSLPPCNIMTYDFSNVVA